MKFIKSWQFMAILVAIVAIVAVAGVIYGVTTHTERGLKPDWPRWSRSDFPLRACATMYEGAPAAAVVAVGVAIDATNQRLGFSAYDPSLRSDDCDVTVVLGYPAEPGLQEPGGSALMTTTAEGVSCDVRISNAHGELQHLAIQHELGHCLGLDDETFRASIMWPMQVETPDREFPPRITDFDRELLRGLYAPRDSR